MIDLLTSDVEACMNGPVVRILQNDKALSIVDHAISDDLGADVFANSLPIRTVPQRPEARHYTGKYFAYTVGAFIQFESIQELRRAQLADSDSSIVDIRSQPLRLVQRTDRLRRYTPDYAIVDKDGGITIVEVKSERALADPQVKLTLEWAEQLFARCGWVLERWSVHPYDAICQNLRYLDGFHDPRLTTSEITATVLDEVRERPRSIDYLDTLLRDTYPYSSGLPAIMHLIWNGQLCVDMWSAKLNPTKSVVSFGSEDAPGYLDLAVLSRRRYESQGLVL